MTTLDNPPFKFCYLSHKVMRLYEQAFIYV